MLCRVEYHWQLFWSYKIVHQCLGFVWPNNLDLWPFDLKSGMSMALARGKAKAMIICLFMETCNIILEHHRSLHTSVQVQHGFGLYTLVPVYRIWLKRHFMERHHNNISVVNFFNRQVPLAITFASRVAVTHCCYHSTYRDKLCYVTWIHCRLQNEFYCIVSLYHTAADYNVHRCRVSFSKNCKNGEIWEF